MVSNDAKINLLCGLVDEFNAAQNAYDERLHANQRQIEEALELQDDPNGINGRNV